MTATFDTVLLNMNKLLVLFIYWMHLKKTKKVFFFKKPEQ